MAPMNLSEKIWSLSLNTNQLIKGGAGLPSLLNELGTEG